MSLYLEIRVKKVLTSLICVDENKRLELKELNERLVEMIKQDRQVYFCYFAELSSHF